MIQATNLKMVPTFLFTCLTIFSTIPGNTAEIHLEHSLFNAEGSLWGTEDAFKKKLNLSENQIPQLYKTLNLREPKVTRVSVGHIPNARGRFSQNIAVLLKHVNVCMAANIPKPDANFKVALNTFLDSIGGNPKNGRLINMSFHRIQGPTNSLGHCDLLMIQGNWNQFPYKEIMSPRPQNSFPWDQQVYGIYYRHSYKSLPIITFHPDIKITYSPPLGRYVSWLNSQLVVDGKVLILHEIGHYLGFSHLGKYSSSLSKPELTVMGLANSFRVQNSNVLRFSQASDLWRYWDAYQTSLYRQWLWSELYQ